MNLSYDRPVPICQLCHVTGAPRTVVLTEEAQVASLMCADHLADFDVFRWVVEEIVGSQPLSVMARTHSPPIMSRETLRDLIVDEVLEVFGTFIKQGKVVRACIRDVWIEVEPVFCGTTGRHRDEPPFASFRVQRDVDERNPDGSPVSWKWWPFTPTMRTLRPRTTTTKVQGLPATDDVASTVAKALNRPRGMGEDIARALNQSRQRNIIIDGSLFAEPRSTQIAQSMTWGPDFIGQPRMLSRDEIYKAFGIPRAYLKPNRSEPTDAPTWEFLGPPVTPAEPTTEPVPSDSMRTLSAKLERRTQAAEPQVDAPQSPKTGPGFKTAKEYLLRRAPDAARRILEAFDLEIGHVDIDGTKLGGKPTLAVTSADHRVIFGLALDGTGPVSVSVCLPRSTGWEDADDARNAVRGALVEALGGLARDLGRLDSGVAEALAKCVAELKKGV